MAEENWALAQQTANQAAQAWTNYANNKRNQENFERQMQFQEDSLRSQIMYQDTQYARASHDNDIATLMDSYRRAGLDPREALNRQPNATPMSAPSGMSAPRAPQADSSMLSAMFQQQHESRLDDVQRALSASRLMSDEQERHNLQTSAYKMLMDVLHDSQRIKIDDASLALKWYDIYNSLTQQKAELAEKARQHNESLAETKRHNKAVEEDDPYKHAIQNIDWTLQYMLEKGGSIFQNAGKVFDNVVEDASSTVSRAQKGVKKVKGFVKNAVGNVPRKVPKHPYESATPTYR